MASPKAPAAKKKQHLPKQPARIEQLHVENFRALRSVTLDDLTPITVLLGPNGSGKSTVFDVFNFLSECFQFGLRHAWDRRGRAKEIKTRGQTGPVVIELKYREDENSPLMTYHLSVDEEMGKLVVAEESLAWRRGKKHGYPFKFLKYERGQGFAISGDEPDEQATRKKFDLPLRSPDLLAVNTLGQLAEHPRVAALREFIADWYVSYLSIEDTRNQPEAGPQERLSKTGDNLSNVIQYLGEQHPAILDKIFGILQCRIPRLESVRATPMPDGRLLLQIKDAPFERPILSRFASDGTLKMLAYLVVLHSPDLPQFIGIEEPENFLHHRLLPELAEECQATAERSQLLITTHSPFLLNAFRPEEVRLLYRDELGATQALNAARIQGIKAFMDEGAKLGQLWTEGYFNVGDPFSPAIGGRLPGKKKP